MNKFVYFDLDGVTADFTRAALAAHGATLPILEATWEFPAQIGFAGSADPAFWRPLARHEFWADLPLLADGLALFRLAERTLPPGRVGFLSAAPRDTPGSHTGKEAWVARHFPGYADRLLLCRDKAMVAGPGRVLVDDRDENVRAFRLAGGEAVLVPRPWNRRAAWVNPDGSFDPEEVADELWDLLR